MASSTSTKRSIGEHSLDSPLPPPPPPNYAPPPPPPPPSYHPQRMHHDVALRGKFPSKSDAELPPILSPAAHNDLATNKLPSLSSLTGPPISRPPIPTSLPALQHSEAALPKPKPAVTHWPSMNPFTTYYTPSHLQPSQALSPADVNSDTNSIASPGYESRGPSVSLDDPEVRLAAEALGDLKADFGNSPTNRSTPGAAGSPTGSSTTNPQTPQQEPLFSLLTTSHPRLATTIENATSAYNTSKNFSPRIKSGVEYVEGYLQPIANTVGSVSRVTGVEGGVRWFLGGNGRRPSDSDGADSGSHKRRRVANGNDEMIGILVDPVTGMAAAPAADGDPTRDSFIFRHDRRLSRASTIDTLPAYDDHRSPAYSENDKPGGDRPGSAASARQSRLMLTTSGLAVSMSNESLRSLKYCLRWLRKANEHIGGVVVNLKTTLDQYDQAGASNQDSGVESAERGGDEMDVDSRAVTRQPSEQDQRVLAAKIVALRGDILKSLQGAIETVSKYAGGALPDNARLLVHNHLTTLPQRFRYATMVEQQSRNGTPRPTDEVTRENANRVLVLAKEGLDMITQVSGVIDGTIVCAEEWCDKLGRKRNSDVLLPETRQQAQLNDVKT
ncbi:transcription factor Opi1-domain-containing protein [Plectosphaerella plurivora]|uniref:Transcription factor Opi1-domain-containing protein n=1 Tax=Plectosphaerella plurivora TaxID=936078 RepID=A0A9P8VI77_9PEZI|nr:transcription factor Opi1-domain-containing protein [Plectosphaerella plurivora]